MPTIININIGGSPLLPNQSGERAFNYLPDPEPIPVVVEEFDFLSEREFSPAYYAGLTPIADQIFTRAKNCKKGQSCGNSCISLAKTCASDLKPPQKPPAIAAQKATKSNKKQADSQGYQKTSLAGTLTELSPSDVLADPKRFQYKIIGEHTTTGEVGSLSGVKKFDPNLSGIIQVWQDPADGKTYVVNGHNRLALANKLGADKVAVRYLDVKDAQEARAVGALTNIAEGRGNALDAAKFFKDSGLTKADLDAKGIPMREKIATDGIALSKLEGSLFRKVIDGDISVERGAIIGGSGLDDAQQRSLVDLINKQPKSKNITNEVISELVQTVSASGSKSQFTLDLFGGSTSTVTNALERASLQATIRKKLSTDKKLFGTVAKTKAAQQLASVGNVINTGASKQVSDDAALTLNVFDKLKNVSGPISQKINKAADDIIAGGNKKQIQSDLYQEIVAYVTQGGIK